MKQSPGQLGDNVSRSRLGRRMFLRRLLTRVGKRRNGQGNIEIFICSRNVISSFAQGPKIRRRKMAETKWSEIEHSRTPMVQNSVESEQYTYGLGGHERRRDLRLRLATRDSKRFSGDLSLPNVRMLSVITPTLDMRTVMTIIIMNVYNLRRKRVIFFYHFSTILRSIMFSDLLQ